MKGLVQRVRRVPRALLWIALVALLNALAWGILVPPFHVPDENAHVAYAQYVAETGQLPQGTADGTVFSPEINRTLGALGFYGVVGRTENEPPGTEEEIAALNSVRDRRLRRTGSGDVSSATNNPPLYYAAEAAVYRASPSSDLLTRVALMRILSALLAASTALLGALFVREIVPQTTWAWVAGGLAIALQPMLGFIGGGVNNDNMLFAASGALLFGLARIFRRGVTPRRAVFVGLAFAIGALAKATMIAFAPAVALAFLVVLVRAGSDGRRQALRSVAAGVGAAALPIALFVVLSGVIWDRPIWGAGAAPPPAPGDPTPADVPARVTGTLRAQLSYTWQLFLPKLGLVTQLHPVAHPPTDIWLNGFVGTFGWLDYGFPQWVYRVGHWLAPLVAALAALTLVRERARLHGRGLELATYALAAAGLAALIGAAGYRYWLDTGGQRFEQARYVLPLLPLYGAIVALAVRAVGRRAGPSLAAAAVVVMIGWSLYAQVLTAVRYYG